MIVLAVDDDSEDFEFFSEAVKEIDSSIIILKAANGNEALRILNNYLLMPDFVFLDINMPLMDGKTCLNAIRKSEKLKDIPVIMYSTTTNDAEIKHYKLQGANFLIKPGKFDELVKSLSYILGYSRDRTHFFYVI